MITKMILRTRMMWYIAVSLMKPVTIIQHKIFIQLKKRTKNKVNQWKQRKNVKKTTSQSFRRGKKLENQVILISRAKHEGLSPRFETKNTGSTIKEVLLRQRDNIRESWNSMFLWHNHRNGGGKSHFENSKKSNVKFNWKFPKKWY